MGHRLALFSSVNDQNVGMEMKRAALIKEDSTPLHGPSSHCLLLVQETNRFDDILSALHIAFVSSTLSMLLMHHTSGDFMKYIVVITAAATLAVATPAIAGRATENPEWLMRQKACKKEASAQGLHFSKKRTYVKECMAKG